MRFVTRLSSVTVVTTAPAPEPAVAPRPGLTAAGRPEGRRRKTGKSHSGTFQSTSVPARMGMKRGGPCSRLTSRSGASGTRWRRLPPPSSSISLHSFSPAHYLQKIPQLVALADWASPTVMVVAGEQLPVMQALNVTPKPTSPILIVHSALLFDSFRQTFAVSLLVAALVWLVSPDGGFDVEEATSELTCLSCRCGSFRLHQV